MGYYNPMLKYGLAHSRRGCCRTGGGRLHHPGPAPGGGGTLAGGCPAKAGVATIFLAAPTSGPERIKTLGRLTQGFLYYVSVTGITGARTELPRELIRRLEGGAPLVKCPLAVGFGISTPEQVPGLAPYVDGVVVGSAIVKRVARIKGPESIKGDRGFRRRAQSAAEGLPPLTLHECQQCLDADLKLS